MKKLGLLVALVCVMAMPVAKAGIILEPYVGYSIGSIDASTEDYDTKGIKYGARAGYEMLGFFGALQYEMGSLTLETSGDEGDADDNSFSVIAGYEFPALVRAWVGYSFSGTLEAETGDFDHTAFIIGVGYKPIPMPLPKMDLYINAELRKLSFDNAAIDSGTEFFFSVSVPFNI